MQEVPSFLSSLGGGRVNCHTASTEAHLKAGPLHNPTPYWGLYHIFLRAQLSLRVSLARCQRCSPVVQQVEQQTSPISYPYRLLSSQPRRLQSGCDGLSHFIEDTGGPCVPVREFNIIACRKPDINSTCRQRELNPCCRASQPASQTLCTAAQHISPLSHEDRSMQEVIGISNYWNTLSLKIIVFRRSQKLMQSQTQWLRLRTAQSQYYVCFGLVFLLRIGTFHVPCLGYLFKSLLIAARLAVVEMLYYVSRYWRSWGSHIV